MPDTMQRETIDTGYLRITLKEAWTGDGYRLSHSRMRTPTTGDDVWVPNYTWNLPADGLSEWEVQQMLSRFDAEAKRRYQAEKQRMAERRRKSQQWHKAHKEPDYDIETKYYDGAAHSRILS